MRLTPLLALLGLACAGTVAGPPQDLRPGLGPEQVLAVLEEGPVDDGYRVKVEERFLSRIEQGEWSEVDADELREPRSLGPDVHLAVVGRRSCSDWQLGGEKNLAHQSEARASWFLLRGGSLVAYDHWSFGPRCALENRFRPAHREDRAMETTFLRFVAQRFPDPPPQPEARFARGRAYLEADRLEDARRSLASGDRAMDSWRAAYAHHELSSEDQAAFDEREQTLVRARAELSVALARALREREGEPTDPTERFFEGLDD